MELDRFDTQLMQNPEIEGVEYQQGELQGYETREYVLIKFGHRCAYAGEDSPCDQVLNLDHIVARARGGSNRVSNLTLSCRKHNEEKGDLSLEEYGRLRGEDFTHVNAQAKAPLKDAAAVNSTRWALHDRLKSFNLPVETGSGGLTKFNRTQRGLPKAHWIDAACVGKSTPENLKTEGVQPLRIRATGHGSRQMCSTDKYGFPKATRTHKTSYEGFRTGDIVIADIPNGKFAGRHIGRLTIRQRPSFVLNGFDVNPKYLKRIHRSDGFDYPSIIGNGSAGDIVKLSVTPLRCRDRLVHRPLWADSLGGKDHFERRQIAAQIVDTASLEMINPMTQVGSLAVKGAQTMGICFAIAL